ncbi:YqgE/AlgH family protein [Tenacibaculum sp. L6]|uniref:YqgE/AlgH family protein n=1 Tax=Tenacibaculum sp. L6 TaxID=2992764 RepID=UPI003158B508
MGYSGWSSNQLDEELVMNSWFITENDYDNILTTNDQSFWKDKLLQRGGKYKIWANAPSDIQMN